jgi:hypothetical protein
MRSNPNIRLNAGKKRVISAQSTVFQLLEKIFRFFFETRGYLFFFGVLILKSSVNKTKNGTNEKAPVSFSNWRIRSFM